MNNIMNFDNLNEGRGGRPCWILKLSDEKWYLNFMNEFDQNHRAITFGPFPTEEHVRGFIERNIDNPGKIIVEILDKSNKTLTLPPPPKGQINQFEYLYNPRKWW